MRIFTIGSPDAYCLEATLFMPDVDSRFTDLHICDIAKLDSLSSCLLDKPGSEDISFGAELLYGFINIIKSNYPHITQLSLQDASYLPCNRKADDTLDLLSYNIALYGKTWYEMKFGAHIKTALRQSAYQKGVRNYMSKEAKSCCNWDTFYASIVKANKFTKDVIVANEALYETIFKTSPTWPQCITLMRDEIKKEDRCKFFKGWLETLVFSYVPNERQWIIDIVNNDTMKNVLNTTSARPIRKASRKNSRF